MQSSGYLGDICYFFLCIKSVTLSESLKFRFALFSITVCDLLVFLLFYLHQIYEVLNGNTFQNLFILANCYYMVPTSLLHLSGCRTVPQNYWSFYSQLFPYLLYFTIWCIYFMSCSMVLKKELLHSYVFDKIVIGMKKTSP